MSLMNEWAQQLEAQGCLKNQENEDRFSQSS